jgi:ribosomal protein S18 acetylase RimI-like enzyme
MVTIRPIELLDIQTVQNVARLSWNDTYKEIYPTEYIESFLSRAYSVERLEQSIIRDQKNEGRRFLVAVLTSTQEVIGYIHVMKESERIYELLRIYLLPDYKGKGIGTELINEVKKLNDILRLKAWVSESNHLTRKFYEARDFKIIDEKIQSDDGFTTTLICYEKSF